MPHLFSSYAVNGALFALKKNSTIFSSSYSIFLFNYTTALTGYKKFGPKKAVSPFISWRNKTRDSLAEDPKKNPKL